jgi:ABC-type proline/glycine betaine transport system substrate-binding protein
MELAETPAVIAYLKKREVPIRDVLSLEELFSQKGAQAAKEYLEKHYDQLAEEKRLVAAVYQNLKTI